MRYFRRTSDGACFAAVGWSVVPPEGHTVRYARHPISFHGVKYRRFAYFPPIADVRGKIKVEESRIPNKPRLKCIAEDLPFPIVLDHKLVDQETVRESLAFQRIKEESLGGNKRKRGDVQELFTPL